MRNNWFRFLLMFGPMIYNGISRFMRDRKRKEVQENNAPRPVTRRQENQEHEQMEAEHKKPKYKEDDLV